jgi:RND family efflux transporter MFP subunit
VATTPVEARRLGAGLEVTGTLTADAQTDLAAEVAGRVIEVLIERGAHVKAGAPLARLDPQTAQHQLREAEATEAQTRVRLGLVPGKRFDPREIPEVRVAQLNMEQAEADFKRYAELVDAGAVSRSEHDLKRTSYLSAKEQYESTVNQQRQLYETLLAQQARVAQSKKGLADTVVRAPYDGVVAERAVSVGQVVPAGGRIATLLRVHPLRVELTIPEAAVAAVARGQKVQFRVQSYPDRQFEGTIAYLGPAVRTDSRALVAEAVVPNPEALLPPGLFATARIELPGGTPVMVVPAAAVRRVDAVARVYVVKAGRAEARVVQLGRAVGDLWEVVTGVTVGERVVTEGADRVSDGMPVRDTSPKTP